MLRRRKVSVIALGGGSCDSITKGARDDRVASCVREDGPRVGVAESSRPRSIEVRGVIDDRRPPPSGEVASPTLRALVNLA